MSVGGAIEPLAKPGLALHAEDPAGAAVVPVAPTRRASSAFFDRFGALLGFACAIHCMVVPLALGVMPALGLGFLANESVEHGIVAVATAFAAAGAWIGWRSHHDRRIVLAFAGAIGLLFASHALGDHDDLGPRALSVAGGFALALTHLWNTRRSRSCDVPTHAHR